MSNREHSWSKRAEMVKASIKFNADTADIHQFVEDRHSEYVEWLVNNDYEDSLSKRRYFCLNHWDYKNAEVPDDTA